VRRLRGNGERQRPERKGGRARSAGHLSTQLSLVLAGCGGPPFREAKGIPFSPRLKRLSSSPVAIAKDEKSSKRETMRGFWVAAVALAAAAVSAAPQKDIELQEEPADAAATVACPQRCNQEFQV